MKKYIIRNIEWKFQKANYMLLCLSVWRRAKEEEKYLINPFSPKPILII